MNGTQYEEFCRRFLANELKIPIEKIRSDMIPNATLPGLTQYSQQIDLWWQDENDLIEHINIADAKWRSSAKVEKGDVEKLLQAKEGIRAHKAMMITNNGFTKGAMSVAENHRIALHIVHPNFDYVILDPKNRKTMQTQLQDFFNISKPVYMHVEVCKGIDLEMDATGQSAGSSRADGYTKKIAKTSMNKIAPQGSNRRVSSNLQKVQSGSGTGKQGTSQTGRQGGPLRGRQGGSVTKGSGPARGRGGTSNRKR